MMEKWKGGGKVRGEGREKRKKVAWWGKRRRLW